MVAEDQLAPRPAPPRDTALSPSSLPLPADESPSPPPGAAAYRVPVDVASAVVALRSPGAKVGGPSVLIQRCRLHCVRSTRGSCTDTPALPAVTMQFGRTSPRCNTHWLATRLHLGGGIHWLILKVDDGSACGWPPLHLALLRGESHLQVVQLLPSRRVKRRSSHGMAQ